MNVALGGGRLCQYVAVYSSYSQTKPRDLNMDWLRVSVSAWDEPHDGYVEQAHTNEMSRQPDLSCTSCSGYHHARSRESECGSTIAALNIL